MNLQLLAAEITKPAYASLTDSEILISVQALEVATDKKKVGSGQARGYFVNKGIWTTLRTIQDDKTHPLFALADAVIVTASDASSYFGLDPDTAEGQGNIAGAQILVDAGVMTAAERDGFLALAFKTTKPFADATLEDIANARLEGVTQATSINHVGGLDYQVTLKNEDYRVSVIFDDPVPVDCTVTLHQRVCPSQLDNQVDTNYVLDKRPIDTHYLSAGDISHAKVIQKPLGKWIKITAECNYNLPFNVYVETV
jgi:hypothetical protein